MSDTKEEVIHSCNQGVIDTLRAENARLKTALGELVKASDFVLKHGLIDGGRHKLDTALFNAKEALL